MAIFGELLGFLAKINFLSWIIAAIGGFWAYAKSKDLMWNNAWLYIAIGSLFVVVRQVIKFLPSYDSEATHIFNTYMLRYVFGAVGAILLMAGFVIMIKSYYKITEKNNG